MEIHILDLTLYLIAWYYILKRCKGAELDGLERTKY